MRSLDRNDRSIFEHNRLKPIVHIVDTVAKNLHVPTDLMYLIIFIGSV